MRRTIEPDKAAIGARLAHVRAHVTQRAFAEEIGVPLRTYQTYERGEREPNLQTLIATYERGWSLNWLLTGEGPERLEALSGAAFFGSVTDLEGASQALRLDPDTLLAAIETVDEALQMPGVPEFSPRGRAQLALAVYRNWAREQPTPVQAVSMVLRTIREAMHTGALDE